MPIGKNSIKRAANNGYSKVTTAAPDMESSVVVEVKKEEPKKDSAAEVVIPEEDMWIIALIEERKAAKKAKDFARADAIRAELLEKGVTIIDTREGTKYTKEA